MKKERDYHRQHHNRIAQEKNNLVTFVKRYENEKQKQLESKNKNILVIFHQIKISFVDI